MKTHTSQPFYNRSADSRGKYPRNSLTAPLCTFISINPPDEKVKYYSAEKNRYRYYGYCSHPDRVLTVTKSRRPHRPLYFSCRNDRGMIYFV